MPNDAANASNVVALSPLPLHTQIREALRAAILDGTYREHAQLPSESELTAKFGVSRITVRHALAQLQREGLIFKVTGKGTFVSKPKAFQDLNRLQGFGEAMHRLGRATFSQVLGHASVRADAALAQRLAVNEGDTVIELKRVRYLDRVAVSLDVSYFPASIGEEVLRADVAARDVFSILENEIGIALGAAEVSIEAALAEGDIATHLGVAEGAPLLRIERLTTAADGRPVDFEYLYYRGDVMRYRVRLERTPDAATAGPEEAS
jgi:GntR family transcriptional regulator